MLVLTISVDGSALNWYRSEEERDKFLSWSNLKERLLVRFRSSRDETICGRYLHIKQETTVEEYGNLFDKLVAPLSDLQERVVEDTFMNDLFPWIRAEVAFCRPKGLVKMMQIAQLVENREIIREVNLNGFSRGKYPPQTMETNKSGASNNVGKEPEGKELVTLEVKGDGMAYVELSINSVVGLNDPGIMKVMGKLQEEEVDWIVKEDFLPLELGGVDIIVGMQWLHSLGVTVVDWKNLSLTFNGNEKQICIKGDPSLTKARISLKIDVQSNETNPVHTVLEQYVDIFEWPDKLPPRRDIEHHIHLKKGTDPINVRPYRYGYHQKEEMEKLVGEMLALGVIRSSTSPFSSPVLVKKKDGSWRFCLDYRAVNNATIPDKFPILVVEELFDELNGATLFSKIDLKSGYHKIRMVDEDIEKTTFRTQEGHYEFLVIPFGLTNAPATFQAFLNAIFKPHLRKFVLVFFDDMLIYSKNADEHVKHMELVFSILRKHELRFVQQYGSIAAPLTLLLKKGGFKWNEEAEEPFERLKKAMMSLLVLALPSFDHPFEIETDASGYGVGIVVIYKSGLENKAADALSRKPPDVQFCGIFVLVLIDLKTIKEVENDFKLQKVIAELGDNNEQEDGKYTWQNGMLKYKNRLNLQEVAGELYWEGMNADVKKHCVECLTCQRNKILSLSLAGLLVPLEIPQQIWSGISMDFMDFVEGLLKAKGHEVVLVVVDRLSNEKPKEWVASLPWVEFWYNTSFQRALGVTPFQVVYRRKPFLLSYGDGDTSNSTLDEQLRERDIVLAALREHLLLAQQQMKLYVDCKRRNVEYQPTIQYVNENFEWKAQSEEILGYQKNKAGSWEVLICWEGLLRHEAS
ncbi:Transposon Ty3-G Gag-Pol polyprotein [Cucumis melo var. makuwa]|uniref:Transposon Ty3-G Gag-Pol polyprotein n=1 Tax=Cucumis melo var. makuwa TaxID=1194695 RepID=A0A5D3BB46_CUCMM|nr:Transposon Ty3-G Gag-Pol polyprotein [Cucumis melo var. makuwa]TYJ95588.1 Transposon Ty3-G Gag-Pol polyprotein [Cucumis melo var. makuwa]